MQDSFEVAYAQTAKITVSIKKHFFTSIFPFGAFLGDKPTERKQRNENYLNYAFRYKVKVVVIM